MYPVRHTRSGSAKSQQRQRHRGLDEDPRSRAVHAGVAAWEGFSEGAASADEPEGDKGGGEDVEPGGEKCVGEFDADGDEDLGLGGERCSEGVSGYVGYCEACRGGGVNGYVIGVGMNEVRTYESEID